MPHCLRSYIIRSNAEVGGYIFTSAQTSALYVTVLLPNCRSAMKTTGTSDVNEPCSFEAGCRNDGWLPRACVVGGVCLGIPARSSSNDVVIVSRFVNERPRRLVAALELEAAGCVAVLASSNEVKEKLSSSWLVSASSHSASSHRCDLLLRTLLLRTRFFGNAGAGFFVEDDDDDTSRSGWERTGREHWRNFRATCAVLGLFVVPDDGRETPSDVAAAFNTQLLVDCLLRDALSADS